MFQYAQYLRLLLLTIAFLTAGIVDISAQNKKTLEDKRKKLAREIEMTNKLLNKTKQNKTAAYDRFTTLQNQIERRESLIETIENEVVEAESDLQRNAAVIASLNDDLSQMKEEYGKMVRNTFRRNAQTNPLLFLISAENLNQMFRRWLFLLKYNRFRKAQAEAIAFTQNMLSKKLQAIEIQKKSKEDLLLEIQGQKGALTTELDHKDELLKSLEKNENRLLSELRDKQVAKAALDQSIEQIISAEIRKKEIAEATKKQEEATAKASKEASKTPDKPVKTPEKTTPATPPSKTTASSAPARAPEKPATTEEVREEDNTSLSFRKLRGKLPWPVENGFIARPFGRQKHPTLKNIEITNNGIDIKSTDDAPVKAVFDGKVAGVQYIPGHDYTVILQHGNYYTVYSNLSQTNLSKGQEVPAGALIGRVSTNPISGAAELHFELWREKERLNPASWIK